MADDMEFENFGDLENLDWSQLDQEHKESAQGEEGSPKAAAGGEAAEGIGNEAMISTGEAGIDIHYLLDVNLQITVEVAGSSFSSATCLRGLREALSNWTSLWESH